MKTVTTIPRSMVMIAVLLVFSTGTALASDPCGCQEAAPAGKHFRRPVLRLLTDLELTDAQKGDLAAVLDKYAVQRKAFKEQLIPAMRALRTATLSETFDESAIRAAGERLHAVQLEGSLMRARMMAEMRPVLSSEQIEIVEAALEHWRGRAERGWRFGEAFIKAWLAM